MAVLQESLTKSVWSYAVPHEGSRENCLVDQILEDLETIGLKTQQIFLKSDQENSIVDCLKEVQKRREGGVGAALET